MSANPPNPQKDGESWFWQDEIAKDAFTNLNELLTALDVLHEMDPRDNVVVPGQAQGFEDALKQAQEAHCKLGQLLEDAEMELSELQSQAEEAYDGEDVQEEDEQ